MVKKFQGPSILKSEIVISDPGFGYPAKITTFNPNYQKLLFKKNPWMV